MSEHKAEVCRYKLRAHSNADALEIADVKGWQCIVKKGDFPPEGLAVYVPINMVMDQRPEYEFLKPYKYRVKTIRLRGELSQGLLLPSRPEWHEGQDVTEAVGAKRYDPPSDDISPGTQSKGPVLHEPDGFTHYTDIENWNNWPGKISFGEPCVITEKIHGTNARYGLVDGDFLVGSRSRRRDPAGDDVYCKVAKDYDIHARMNRVFGTAYSAVIYGEIYGRIQKLRYGLPDGFAFRVFDIALPHFRRYMDWEEVENFSKQLGLDLVPIYKTGSLREVDLDLRRGQAFQGGHVREGIVIHPLRERFDMQLGRVILKRINEDYLLSE